MADLQDFEAQREAEDTGDTDNTGVDELTANFDFLTANRLVRELAAEASGQSDDTDSSKDDNKSDGEDDTAL